MLKANFKPRRISKLWLSLIILIILLAGGSVLALRAWYQNNLQPVSSSSRTQYFSIEQGSSLHQIAVKLKSEGLIKSTRAFETYVRSNELHDELQAGTYNLSPSMTVAQIVEKMIKGDVARNLITILPQKRLDQIKAAFLKDGYSQAEVDNAFEVKNYRSHPALASLPEGASLEGYLYPDSYDRQIDTPAKVVIRESLDEMQKYLTQDIVNGFAARGLNVFQGITLASIVAQETDDPQVQPSVAQVFYTRLSKNMVLGSDVTAFYAAVMAGVETSLTVDSPYNTRIHGGLPPGPISNMTFEALKAAANPAKTDYLYFVAGDDDKVYFSHTIEEHNEAARKYCIKKCQL